MPFLFDNLAFSQAAWLLAVATGVIVGLGTWKSLRDCQLNVGWTPLWYGLAGVGLAWLVVQCSLPWNTLGTPEVLPAELWREWRVAWHLALLTLLLMITATDLRSYYILDWNCWLGLLIGVGGATLSGEFQLAHVWVDWNAEIKDLAGPYIPAWLARHQHLHGLAWSVAGAACGATLTWQTRWLSQWVLDRPTLGMGDVLLMGMVGSFLGWQPVTLAIALAPLMALLVGGMVSFSSNRAALPYGPFLALASLIVLLNWRVIWMWEFALSANVGEQARGTFALRRFFGDPVGLLILAGVALVLFIVLLGLLRIYKTLPITPPPIPISPPLPESESPATLPDTETSLVSSLPSEVPLSEPANPGDADVS